MVITDRQRRLLQLCSIRSDRESVDWSLIARQVQFDDGLDAMWDGIIREKSAAATRSAGVLRRGVQRADELAEKVDAEVEAASRVGARLVTVLDDEYPANLRLTTTIPPFLFFRGEVTEADTRSVAVVGARNASADGIQHARRMSRLLAERGVTVISGLARGIDTSAHRSALDCGGRTIAVLGTGITRCYPAENRELSESIASAGALVSQFWPTRAPGRDTFPRRNVVTSGLSQGTVVIEASSTSGAKMQARLALADGKTVFLVESLVMQQKWAKSYVEKYPRRAIVVKTVEDVVTRLRSVEQVEELTSQRRQLSFDLA